MKEAYMYLNQLVKVMSGSNQKVINASSINNLIAGKQWVDKWMAKK
jgi:hypothetical protein